MTKLKNLKWLQMNKQKKAVYPSFWERSFFNAILLDK